MKYYSAIFFQVHCDCLDKRMREFRNLYIVYRGNSTMKPLICLGVAMTNNDELKATYYISGAIYI